MDIPSPLVVMTVILDRAFSELDNAIPLVCYNFDDVSLSSD